MRRVPQHDRVGPAVSVVRLRRSLGAVALLVAATCAHAAGRAIEDVRFVKQNGVARAEIVFACPVRYLSHTPDSGADVQVRIVLDPECVAELGSGVRSELFDPPAGNLAGVKQVVFDTTVEDRVARVAINVGRVVRFAVSQGPMRNVLRVELEQTDAVAQQTERVPDLAPSSPPPLAQPRAAPAPGPAPAPGSAPMPAPAGGRAEHRRTAASRARASAAAARAASRGARRTLRDPARGGRGRGRRGGRPGARGGARDLVRERAAARRPRVAGAAARILRLRERRARAARDSRDGVSERSHRHRDGRGAGRGRGRAALAGERAHRGHAGGRLRGAPRALPELTPERVDALVAEANDAMLAENYDRSIQIYTRLLEEPGFGGRREARERLGIARERKGQVAQARHEYGEYLAEFPDGADAERVRQRLAGLVAAAAPARERVETVTAAESTWEYDGGVAQYYRRDVYRPLDGLPDETLQSAFVSNVNLVVRRHGERFELGSRVDAQYRYNLIDEDDAHASWRDPADQLYLTNAYVNVADQQRDWSARVGRQSLRESGVLGRFDGARAAYQWRPQVGLNLTLGRPVDYPRHAVDGHRQFIAFSADLDELVKQWDVSFFGLVQEVDGLSDRQALGAEARYRGTEWSVVSSVDYDVSYGVLNSALVSANWRATDRLMLNGRLNVGTAPFLTTHNALIGQSAATIEDLLRTYSEGQIRRIARNRTAQAHDGALGLSWPVFDRYQLNVDLMFSEFDATVASAGVMALPASGAQTFVQATLVGSSVLKSGDTAIFSLRHGDGRTATTDTFVFDVRLPSAQRLRLNPRIALTSRVNVADGSEQWIAAPMLRLAMRWPSHHRVELELGGQWSDKELPAPDPMFGESTEKTSAYFVNAGYWWEF